MFYLGWLLVLIGLFVVLSGIIALFRFPDFFTKLHAASVIECFGIPICLIGLACVQPLLTSAFKLIFIAIMIFILSPVSSHALGRSALRSKVDNQGRIK
jgi:multicomponent Na+:H+ antiporter subunit G